MAKQLQLRRGTTSEHSTFTGAVGEVTVDTTKDTLVVHDGVTVGGFPVAARANNDGTISLIKKDGTVSMTIPTGGFHEAARANNDGTISLIKKDGTVSMTIPTGGLLNNTLTSTATNQAATAAQAKVLKDLVDTKLTITDTITNAEKLTTATGSAPSYSARAWVNFSSLTNPLKIKGQGNIASVVDHGAGDFTINFATPMPDANYAVSFGSVASASSGGVLALAASDMNYTQHTSKSKDGFRIINKSMGSSFAYDLSDASVVIYR